MQSVVFDLVQKWKQSAVPDRWDAESGLVALLSRAGLQVLIAVKTVVIDGRKQRKGVFVVWEDAVVQALGCLEVFPLAGFDRGRAEALGRRGRTVRHPSSRHYEPTPAPKNTTSTQVTSEFCLLTNVK